MISAFGSFVVKDNYVVGSVIFVILVIIQYFVIVKGTERNAEVGARFMLDGMPGKQMSIDADLGAGLIDESEALRRREDLSREANFFGAMDGASKFVRGDAIAGIIIAVVNIAGGFVIGVLQLHMPAGEALRTYTRLTIGDGLVSQIPALVVSTAAGLVVSRAAAAEKLGAEMGRQLFDRRRPLVIVAATMAVLAFVPGIPTVPLLVLAAVLWGLSRGAVGREQRRLAAEAAHAPAPPVREDAPEEFLRADRLEVAVGFGLIPLLDREDGNDFLDRVVSMRRQIASELGIIVPKVRIRDDVRLKPDHYEVRLRCHRVDGGRLLPGHWLAMGNAAALANVEGIGATEPAFGLAAKWVTGVHKARAEDQGLTVVTPSVVLATHLTEIVKNHSAEILSRQDLQALLDELKKDSPALVKDIVPEVVGPSTLHRVLQNLLRERVPIRDLGRILEVLADCAPQTRDPDVLSESARAALARAICDGAASAERKLEVVSMDPALEQLLAQSTREGTLAMAPQETDDLVRQLRAHVAAILERGERPALVCSPRARLTARRLFEASLPTLPVIAYHELASDLDVRAVAVLRGPATRSAMPAPAAALAAAGT
jgi:flagellar biosynthesis protein FlhA